MASSEPPEPAMFDETTNLPVYKFPPFPKPPPGVKLIPFKDFKPKGIQCPSLGSSDGIERDGEGIPTIRLAIDRSDDTEHVYAVGGGKKKKKSKKKKGGGGFEGPAMTGNWWERWDAEERERGTDVLNLDLTREMKWRFEVGAQRFETRRFTSECQSILDSMWLLFGYKPRHLQMNMRNKGPDSDDSEVDDLEDVEAPRLDAAGVKKQEVAEAVGEEGLKSYDAAVFAEEDMKAERQEVFFRDMEKLTKVFLSSYFREKGLLWSAEKCHDAPILVEFLFRFLDRNKILWELEKDVKAAMAVAHKARIELPATGRIAHNCPGKLSQSFIETFGVQEPGVGWDYDPESIDKGRVVPSVEWGSNNGTHIIDHDILEQSMRDSRKRPFVDMEEEPEAVSADEVIRVDEDGTTIERMDIQRPPNEFPSNANQMTDHSGWGTGEDNGGWGRKVDDGDPWRIGEEEAAEAWVHKGPPVSLMSIFGPVRRTFVHTHKPVMLESGLRRIGQVSLPPVQEPVVESGGGAAVESAAMAAMAAPVTTAVEQSSVNVNGARSDVTESTTIVEPFEGWNDLDRMGMGNLACVVMRPVKIAEGSKMTQSKALKLPISPRRKDGKLIEAEEVNPDLDPRKKTIKVLMDPQLAKLLVKDMILGGAFVKLSPKTSEETALEDKADRDIDDGVDDDALQSEKRAGERGWWYLEKAVEVLPSYYEEINSPCFEPLID